MRLPANAGPPGAVSVAQVADAFGLLAQHFGDVTALAPPTMTVLYAPPPDMNPFDGMPMEDALKLLAASLSPAQWRRLTGASGLGLSDLNTDDQRALFRALFPGGTLKVRQDVAYVPGQPYKPPVERDVTSDLPQARLRLSQKVELMLPMRPVGEPPSFERGGSFQGFGLLDKPDAAPHYQVNRPSLPPIPCTARACARPSRTRPRAASST